MKAKARIIIHMDMDHFYTAIEEREHPELIKLHVYFANLQDPRTTNSKQEERCVEMAN